MAVWPAANAVFASRWGVHALEWGEHREFVEALRALLPISTLPH